MTRAPTRIVRSGGRRPAVAVAALAAVVAVGGCGSSTVSTGATGPATAPGHTTKGRSTVTASPGAVPATAPSPTTTSPSPFGTANRLDATGAAEAMLEANFTSNTTIDTTPFDATRRALAWYAPAAAAKVLAEAPTGPVGAEWITWTDHKVVTHATVQVNTDPGAPPDTATTADRQFNVLVAPHGADGWSAPTDQYQCFVTLGRADASSPWQVTDLQATT